MSTLLLSTFGQELLWLLLTARWLLYAGGSSSFERVPHTFEAERCQAACWSRFSSVLAAASCIGSQYVNAVALHLWAGAALAAAYCSLAPLITF